LPGAGGGGIVSEGSDGQQVSIPCLPDLRSLKGHQCLRLSASGDKLYFEEVRIMNLDNGAEIACTQVILGQITLHDNRVEQRQVHA